MGKKLTELEKTIATLTEQLQQEDDAFEQIRAAHDAKRETIVDLIDLLTTQQAMKSRTRKPRAVGASAAEKVPA